MGPFRKPQNGEACFIWPEPWAGRALDKQPCTLLRIGKLGHVRCESFSEPTRLPSLTRPLGKPSNNKATEPLRHFSGPWVGFVPRCAREVSSLHCGLFGLSPSPHQDDALEWVQRMAAAEGASQEPYESVFARSAGRQQLDCSVASMLPPSAWITEATLRRLCLERLGAQGVGPDGVGSDDSPPHVGAARSAVSASRSRALGLERRQQLSYLQGERYVASTLFISSLFAL